MKEGNATKCSPLRCNANSITSDRACCKAADPVAKGNALPVYPFVEEKKKEAKKSLA